MNMTKRIVLIICTISLFISVVGCDVVKIDPEKDRQRVVAKVDDNEILKGDFLDLYEQYKSIYGITDEVEENSEYEDTIKQIKEVVLDSLIKENVIYNKAVAAGFEVDDEIKTEVRNQMLEYIEESLKLDEDNKDKDIKKLAEEQLEEQLSEYIQQIGITEEEFWEREAKYEQINRFMDEMLKDIEVTDEDIQKYYDEKLKEQKENPESIDMAPVQLYRPEGYIRVKHILIGLSDSDQSEYETLLYSGDEEAADKFLQERLAELEPKANNVLAKVKSGEDFENLIEEYSDDLGMDIDEGYVLNENSNFVESFKEAAFNLKKEGDISDLVASDFGYHIIKLYEILPEKTFTIDETKDMLKIVVEDEKKNERWTSLVEDWQEEANIKKYEKRL
ncbi:MAG TPA: hypothetical protein GX392_06985 [Clostridiales bacterium]|nr:hypothetical protein [Clostridiales bacterium]